MGGTRCCMIGLAGALAVCAAASAQVTRLSFEVSRDALNWSVVEGWQPQTTYYVRLRVRLEQATAIGLSGLTCEPTLSGWSQATGDERLPFTFPGLDNTGLPTSETAYDGRQVSAAPATNLGRIFPFGSGGQGLASSSGLLTSFTDPGNVLRFAGSRWSSEIAGPWGVSLRQQPAALMGTNFVASLDAVVFRYAIRSGDAPIQNEMVASLVGLAGGMVRWYRDLDGLFIIDNSEVVVESARIVVPTPAALAMFGAVIAGSARRRRRP